MSALQTMPERLTRVHGPSKGARVARGVCVAVTLGFLGLFLVVPLVSVFYEALRSGWSAYWRTLSSADSVHSMKVTLLVALVAVPLNTLFGVAAAWAVSKFQFRGKALLLTIIDIPFAVSPVVAGLLFVLLFGRQGLLGPWLHRNGFEIIHAFPGMVLATIFVTFPFVARELIPLMQEQGSQEEQAAISLGANGWQTFWRVTVPNIKWGLLYGIILCNARAMGEFGAVSVVTLNAPGMHNTVPREIQNMYDGFDIPGAFALSTVLAMLGVVTLMLKTVLEWKIKKQLAEAVVE